MFRCDNYLPLIFTLVSKFAGYQAYIKIEKLSVCTVFSNIMLPVVVSSELSFCPLQSSREREQG